MQKNWPKQTSNLYKHDDFSGRLDKWACFVTTVTNVDGKENIQYYVP